MPYVAAIGHRVSIHDLLDRFSFEDLEEVETVLSEAGLSVFSNESEDIFITIADKYKIVKGHYMDMDFKLDEEEYKLLQTYTNQNDKRVKLFWFESNEENPEISSDFDELLAMGTIFKMMPNDNKVDHSIETK